MLIVTIRADIVRVKCKPRSRTLPLKPCKTLLAHYCEPATGPLAFSVGTQRVHHHVVLDGTASFWVAAANDRIGAQAELKPVARFQNGQERLGFRNFEQPVLVFRAPRRKDEKLSGSHLPPKKVAAALGPVGEQRPDEVMPGLDAVSAAPGFPKQQGR